MSVQNFEELKIRMDQFQQTIHVTLESKRKELSQLVTNNEQDLEEFRIKHENLTAKIQELNEAEYNLKSDITSSQLEAQETSAKLDIYHIKKEKLKHERKVLEQEKLELDNMLSTKQLKIQQQKDFLMKQRQRNNPEVMIYEELLGLKIIAIQEDILRFIFFHVNENDDSLEHHVTLSVGSDSYKIEDCRPQLSDQQITELQDYLTNTGDLVAFLKDVRSRLISLYDKSTS